MKRNALIAFSSLFLISSFIPCKDNVLVHGENENEITFEKIDNNEWNNKTWNIPESYIFNEKADLSTVPAIRFNVDNTLGNDFTFNLGIFDKQRMSNSQDEWLSNGKGSAIFLPEFGDPFWENCSLIPAGFKGQVVLPLSTYIHSGNTLTSPRYTTNNNPVFGIRDSSDNNHGLYSVSDKVNFQNFPTATMDTKFTFYVNNSWTNSAGIDETFTDIKLLNNAEYTEALNHFNDLDFKQIGDKLNETDLDGAVIFKDAATGKTLKYKSHSLNNSISNAISVGRAIALAFRVKSFSSTDSKIDLKINETSSSKVFGLCNGKPVKVHYISLDGTDKVIDCSGALVIPANFDGSIVAPLQYSATYFNENEYDTYANGRLNGGIWQIEFYTYTSNNFFTIADMRAVQSTFDPVEQERVYTTSVIGSTRKDNGQLYAHAKNIDCWSQYSVVDSIGELSPINITEYLEGVLLNDTYSTSSKPSIYQYDTAVITLGSGHGRLVHKLEVDNVDVTDDIEIVDGKFVYKLTGSHKDGTATNIKVSYKEGFNIIYVLNGGLAPRDGNPTFYDKTNVGANAIKLNSPVWANHVFMGWYNRVEFSHNDAFVIEKIDYDFLGSKGFNTDDLILYARWGDEYTISLIDKENNKTSSIQVKLGEALTQEDADSLLTQRGSTYALYSDENYRDLVTLPFYGRELNINLYVKYTLERFTISFQSLGGSYISAVTRLYGSQMGFLLEPFYEGHIFLGWYYSDEFDTKVTNEDIVSSNLVLYAKWGVPGVASQKGTITALLVVDICAGLLLAGSATTFIVKKVIKPKKDKKHE